MPKLIHVLLPDYRATGQVGYSKSRCPVIRPIWYVKSSFQNRNRTSWTLFWPSDLPSIIVDRLRCTSQMWENSHATIKHSIVDGGISCNIKKERTDERGKGSRWHTQRRIYPDVGRQARTLECQRPTFCRLGDLSPQGLAR